MTSEREKKVGRYEFIVRQIDSGKFEWVVVFKDMEFGLGEGHPSYPYESREAAEKAAEEWISDREES